MYGVDDESKVPIGLKPGVGKKQTSFDVTNTPQAQRIVPGNAQRAAQMQAQGKQPVFKGADAEVPTGLKPGEWRQTAQDIANVPLGAAEINAGLLVSAPAQGLDYVRNTANKLAGGAPLAEPDKYSDKANGLIADGVDRAGNSLNKAGNAVKAGTLAALDSTAAPVNAAAPVIASANAGELPAPAAGTATPTATAQAGPASDAGPQAPSNGFAPIGLDPKQFGPGSNNIVGRVGANGVPEFSNDVVDVAGARGQFQAPTGLKPQTQSSQQVAPNGAQALASGTNMPTEPRGLAATGRASNIGNGVGTFSVMGQPGDAAKAIATYDRANAIRAETNKLAQAGEPRGLHIVKDSSRAPSIADMQNAKLEARQAQTADTQAHGLRADRQLDIETSRNQTNDQLNQQLQSFQINAAQRAEQLQAAYQQSTDPQEKAALAEQIRVMTGKEQPNRFTVVPGGQEYDATAAAMVSRPSQVLNNQSGEFVDGQAESGASVSAPPAGAIAALRSNPKMAAAFDQKYGKGAAAKYTGS